MKSRCFLLALLCPALALSGCAAAEGGIPGAPASAATLSAMVLENNGSTILAKPLDGGSCFTAPLRGLETRGADTPDLPVTDKSGKTVSAGRLTPGAAIEVLFDGALAESYPAQVTTCYGFRLLEKEQDADLTKIGAYLAAADSIYRQDEGLNDGISILAVDAGAIPDMSHGEKALFLYRLHKEYGLEVLNSTFDRLRDDGYISADKLNFPDGILIQFQSPVYDQKTETLTCGVSKWHSGLGAIGYDSTTVSRDGDGWAVTHKDGWIS